MENSEKLLQEFPPVTTEAWEEAIRKDLKGADYAKKLVWRGASGIMVKPYYRAEDLAGIEYLDAAPGEFPYLRGTSPELQWRIREEIDETDPQKANRRAIDAVAAGAEEISFRLSIKDQAALNTVLAGLDSIRVHFRGADAALLELMLTAKKPALGSADWDPFRDLEATSSFVKRAKSGFRPITIQGSQFEEAGSTTVQEIAYTLAAGIDFLSEMQKRGVEINRAASSVVFSLPIGSYYFFQIAKFRVFRLLWARAVDSFGGSHEAAKAQIHTRTSRWNKTLYDPYVNVLRATTEAMSAAIGGADSIAVAPFDEIYKQPDDASRRLARNTQIILKNEAQLDRVTDPGAGSYFIEVLTDSLARESWRVMQQVEAAGGYGKFRAAGGIQAGLDKARAAKESAIAARRYVFLGTTNYPNPGEKALERLQRPPDGDKVWRGAQAFEAIRLRTERHSAAGGKPPRFLLAEIGDAKMRSARSTFARSFFGCAGFETTAKSFKDVDAIAAADTDVIVLCSSDPEYPALAASLLQKIRAAGRATPVIIAGYPEDSLEALKAAGVADFIHVRSNTVETLTAWQKKLGIAS